MCAFTATAVKGWARVAIEQAAVPEIGGAFRLPRAQVVPPALELAALDAPGLPEMLAELAAARADEMDTDTVNRELSVVRKAIGWWLRQSWIDVDPTFGSERRPSPPDKTKALSLGQVAAVWRLEDVALRDKTLWRLLYESAARAEEVLCLNVEDLFTADKRGRIKAKGGAIEWIHWQCGPARLRSSKAYPLDFRQDYRDPYYRPRRCCPACAEPGCRPVVQDERDEVAVGVGWQRLEAGWARRLPTAGVRRRRRSRAIDRNDHWRGDSPGSLRCFTETSNGCRKPPQKTSRLHLAIVISVPAELR